MDDHYFFELNCFFLFGCFVFKTLFLFLFCCLVWRGARRISLLGETARAVCGNYKSPELGLNLSGS